MLSRRVLVLRAEESVWNQLTVKAVRSFVGIGVGAAILIHETYVVEKAELYLLLTGLACLAGTFALLADEARRK